MYAVKVVFEKGPLNVQQRFTDIRIHLMHLGFWFHSAFTGSMFIGRVCVAECTALIYYYIVPSGHFVI